MDQDDRVREHFTQGGTIMGASAQGGALDREVHTRGMVGGGFGVAGRGEPGGFCQLVLSSGGRACARVTFAENGALLRWEQL